jgi:hypothetical protein
MFIEKRDIFIEIENEKIIQYFQNMTVKNIMMYIYVLKNEM